MKMQACFPFLTSNLWLTSDVNIHRYAFTPLIDDSDDEEIEEFIASENLGIVLCWLTLMQTTTNIGFSSDAFHLLFNSQVLV